MDIKKDIWVRIIGIVLLILAISSINRQSKMLDQDVKNSADFISRQYTIMQKGEIQKDEFINKCVWSISRCSIDNTFPFLSTIIIFPLSIWLIVGRRKNKNEKMEQLEYRIEMLETKLREKNI